MPLVLAGPWLRRVEEGAVSVFLALRSPGTVHLSVHDAPAGDAVMTGSRATVRLGPALHVAVVTARGPAIPAGEPAWYALSITAEGQPLQDLFDDGVLLESSAWTQPIDRLDYRIEERRLRFTVPASRLEDLVLVTGSCRKPHGEGEEDALARLDELFETGCEGLERNCDLIGKGWDHPHHLPQQLLLTGDQIYADDVHPALLARLSAQAEHLCGPAERAELEARGIRLGIGDRAALLRDPDAGAGLSSGEADCHLVLLGEFCAMYLASLAPQPWMDALVDVEELAPFVLGLSRVRRVLAHVSTFCIFDDHEVTDDWYLSRDWARRVLGTPLGRRVIRNALCSYAVFQHWGNDPDAFADGTPGGRLLELIAAWNGTEGPQARQIEACLGMPGADVDDHASLPPGAMRWSWGWEGHAHRLLAIDTRTRRSWPENRLTLACQQDLEAALVPDAGRLTIVLSPPPVMGVQLIELAQRIATWVGHAELADAECWGGSGTEETALERLLDCAPCLCLSGDVHYGFVGTLSRERDGRKDHLVCATSSALHNQALQHGWFLFGRQPERALPQEPEPSTERRLGDDTVHVSILGRPPALPEPGARDLERLLPEASRRRSAIVTGCQVVLISFFDQGTRVRLHYHAREEGAWDEILREATLR